MYHRAIQSDGQMFSWRSRKTMDGYLFRCND